MSSTENAPPQNTQEPSEQVMIGLYHGLIFLLSALLFCPMGLAIFKLYPPPDAALAAAFTDWGRAYLAPEGPERLTYISGLLYFLLVPALLAKALQRHYGGFREFILRHYAARPGTFTAVLYSAFLVWLAAVATRTVLKNKFLPVFLAGAVLSFCFAHWAVYKKRFLPPEGGRAGTWFLWAALALLAVLSLLLFVSDGVFWKYLSVRDSYNVLIGTVNQVLHGRTVLADTASQYGIVYPYLAAAFVKIAGLSLPRLSLFFVLLSFLSLGFLALAVYKKTGASPLSFLLLAAVLLFMHPFAYAAILNIDPYILGPYYAYLPVRVLFGAFLLYFAKVFLDRPTAGNYLLGTGAAAAAVLWNMDTGLVLALSWLLLLCFNSLADKPPAARAFSALVKHVLAIACSVALAAALYALFAKARSGHYPAWGDAFRYPALFYKSGFMMSPMKVFAFWQIPVLVYLLAVFRGMRGLLGGTATADDRWRFFIAVYGLGIFSYYQGRSHFFTLLAVLYPAFLLMAFSAWDILASIKDGDGGRAALCLKRARLAALLLPFSVCLLSFPVKLPGYLRGLDGGAGPARLPERLAEPLSYLRKADPPGKTLVLSGYSEVLHFLSGTASPLPFASLVEIILKEDLAKVQKLADDNDFSRILVGRANFAPTAPLERALVFNGYEPAAPLKDFSVYVPDPKGGRAR